jgi:hypothetical protein
MLDLVVWRILLAQRWRAAKRNMKRYALERDRPVGANGTEPPGTAADEAPSATTRRSDDRRISVRPTGQAS